MTVPPVEAAAAELARIQARVAAAAEELAVELARPVPARNRQRAAAAKAAIDTLLPRMVPALHGLAAILDVPGSSDRGAWQHMRIAVHEGRLRLAQWAAIRQCVLDQLRGEPQALVTPMPSNDPLALHMAISDAALRALQATFGPGRQDDAAKAHGCYPDIPLPASYFLALAHAAYRVMLARRSGGPIRFLDVGCGGGGKVLLAAAFFDVSHGLEVDPGYTEAARALFEATGAARCRAIGGDALAFAGYGEYDVVYFYQPMSDPEKLRLLEDRIVAGIRPGTVLIAPYQEFRLRFDDLGCQEVAEAVFVNGITKAEAEALRAEAEHIGSAVVRERGAEAPLGYWAPIVDASRDNGFDPMPRKRRG